MIARPHELEWQVANRLRTTHKEWFTQIGSDLMDEIIETVIEVADTCQAEGWGVE